MLVGGAHVGYPAPPRSCTDFYDSTTDLGKLQLRWSAGLASGAGYPSRVRYSAWPSLQAHARGLGQPTVLEGY